ncbi:hypothetical protein Bca52824_024792 [Brassica carinata]|uniref:Uncharacterized protein n=1 Tax=Brassica carinata TaxID=52824 RepID=A0A8X7VKW2_BRACI|nr:hypothetical protein Bca52824_024792 [Brassica carinata]
MAQPSMKQDDHDNTAYVLNHGMVNLTKKMNCSMYLMVIDYENYGIPNAEYLQFVRRRKWKSGENVSSACISSTKLQCKVRSTMFVLISLHSIAHSAILNEAFFTLRLCQIRINIVFFWEARNVKRGDHSGGFLLFIDSEKYLICFHSTMIQATINAHRLSKFRDRLAARKIYSLSEFDEITEPVSPLPKEGFRFRNQAELVGLANTNTQLPDTVSEITALVVWDIGLPSAAPLLRAYAKVENVTMAELNNFIITASSQEIDFLCTGRVSCVDTDKGWCCVACLCAVESCIVPPLHLNVCGAVILMLSERCSIYYRVELAVADDTGEGTLKKEWTLRILRCPRSLQIWTFQVRVTSYNFTVTHQTFTVSRIINEIGRVAVPNLGDNSAGKKLAVNVDKMLTSLLMWSKRRVSVDLKFIRRSVA